MPGAGEHDRSPGGANQIRRVLNPVVVLHQPEMVACVDRLPLHGAGFVADGIVLVVPAEDGDVAVERGREEKRLPMTSGGVEDPLDGWEEPHVGHSVGFVNHRYLHLAEVDGSLFDEILEPPGGGHENVDPPAERRFLRAVSDTSVDSGDETPCCLGQGCQLLLDLLCQLTSGSKDECLGAVALRLVEPGQKWQAERQRFARASGCFAAYIPAGQGVGNGCGLNRERLGDVLFVERTDELFGQPELGECNGHMDSKGKVG